MENLNPASINTDEKIKNIETVEETKIFFLTNLKQIPENCLECRIESCVLPLKGNFEVKKEYYKKRHKDCPLREIKI